MMFQPESQDQFSLMLRKNLRRLREEFQFELEWIA
jgi:hypothetical protein